MIYIIQALSIVAVALCIGTILTSTIFRQDKKMVTTRGYQPRTIHHPETLRIGDLIEVSFKINTATIQTYRGTIASREHYGHNITSYFDQDGFALLTLENGKSNRMITLLKPAPELEQVMLDM